MENIDPVTREAEAALKETKAASLNARMGYLKEAYAAEKEVKTATADLEACKEEFIDTRVKVVMAKAVGSRRASLAGHTARFKRAAESVDSARDRLAEEEEGIRESRRKLRRTAEEAEKLQAEVDAAAAEVKAGIETLKKEAEAEASRASKSKGQKSTWRREALPLVSKLHGLKAPCRDEGDEIKFTVRSPALGTTNVTLTPYKAGNEVKYMVDLQPQRPVDLEDILSAASGTNVPFLVQEITDRLMVGTLDGTGMGVC